jgi:hypothetical protein
MPLWRIMQRIQWRQKNSSVVWKSQHMTSTFTYHIVLFQIPILFVWCRFSFKVITTYTRGIIKILNVMVFHSINLVLMHIILYLYKITNLNVRLIVLLISMSCFIFLGGLRICCLNRLYGSILYPMYILLLFSHLMLYTKCSCMLFKELLLF